MKSTGRIEGELAIAMTTSAGLELFWSAIAVGFAMLGIVGPQPLTMAAISAVATALALLAHTGELAARWPRPADMPSAETSGLNVMTGLGALLLASLAIAGVAPLVLAPVALLALAGLLVLDAPLESDLGGWHGAIAGGVMVLGGLSAVIVLVAGFAARDGVPVLVPWAALVIALAYMTGAASVLLRFARATS